MDTVILYLFILVTGTITDVLDINITKVSDNTIDYLKDTNSSDNGTMGKSNDWTYDSNKKIYIMN